MTPRILTVTEEWFRNEVAKRGEWPEGSILSAMIDADVLRLHWGGRINGSTLPRIDTTHALTDIVASFDLPPNTKAIGARCVFRNDTVEIHVEERAPS